MVAISIPTNVSDIGYSAFDGCQSLVSIEISDKVLNIGSRVFANCLSLTSVSIPSGVTNIGGQAFAECRALSSVSIPQNVISIGEAAFANCTALGSGVVVIDDCVLAVNAPCPERVIIPEGIRLIAAGVFQKCSELCSIAIPSGLPKIEDNTFYGCSNLSAINIPEGVRSIGYGAFMGCSSLLSVSLPSTTTNIDQYAFYGCNALTRFDVNKDNPNYCSRNAMLLTHDGRTLILGVNGEVVIPRGVECIAMDAFCHRSKLIGVTVPSSVTNIGSYAFENCQALKNIDFLGDAPTCGYEIFGWGIDYMSPCVVRASRYELGWPSNGQWQERPLVFVNDDLSRPPVYAEQSAYYASLVQWLRSQGVISEESTNSEVRSASKRLDANGAYYWEDFVSGVDPSNPADVFKATIKMIASMPIVSWCPVLSDEQTRFRKYTIWGRVDLNGEWIRLDNASGQSTPPCRFFKVTVDMK